jgi:PAS domain S-box-containing protein
LIDIDSMNKFLEFTRTLIHKSHLSPGGHVKAKVTSGNEKLFLQKINPAEILPEDNEIFRYLFENNSSAIAIIERDTTISMINEAYCKMSGYTKNEVIGKSWTKHIPLKDLERLKDYNRKRLINPEDAPEKYEFSFYHKSGEIKYAFISVSFLPNNQKIIASFTDITNIKHAEETIRLSEGRLMRAELASKSGNWELHFDTQKLIASAGAMKIYGLSKNQFEFSVIKKYPLPEYREMLDSAMHNLIEYNIPYDVEFKIKSGDTGEIKDIHSIGIVDREKKILFGIIQDITERKKAEEQLNILKYSIDTAPDGAYWMDTEGRFIYINDAGCKALGYTREELLEMSVFDVNIEVTHEIWPRFWKHLKENINFTSQTVHRRKDGSEFPVEITSSYCKFGENEYCNGFAKDITDRKRAEEALMQSETKYRSLIETTDTGYVILDPGGKVIDANKEYIRLSGHESIEQISGRKVTDWTAKHDLVKNSEEIENCLRQGSVRNLEIEYLDKDGRFTPVEINATVIKTADSIAIVALCRDITNRKVAEKELLESEEHFRTVIENASVGVCLTSPEGKFITVNQSMCDLLGYSENELKELNFNDVTHVDDRQLGSSILKPLLSGEINKISIEKRYLHKMGHLIWSIVSISLIRDSLKEPKYFVTHVQDITERKKAEERIQESENKFRKIYENGPLGMAIVDRNFYFTMANHTFCRMLGYHENELMTFTFKDITHPDYISKDIENINKLIAGEIPLYKTEKRYIRKDNQLLWGSLTVAANCSNDGKFLYLVAMIEDITERKLAEESLRRSRKEFQTYFDSGAVGLSVTAPDKTWIEVNQRLCQILGYSKNELLKFTWADISHPDDIIENMNLFQLALDRKIDNYEIDKRFIRKDGSIVYVTLSVVCQRNDDGSLHHLLSSYIDITERKLAEIELVAAKVKAEESDRLKTAFLHNITHEIRTPMNAIMGFSGLINDPNLLPEKRINYTDIIIKSSNQLLSIITDIVSIATIEAGQEKVNEKEINLNQVFKFIYEQFAANALNKGLELSYKTNLSDEEALIRTDETKLTQILTNLIGNAIKFTDEGYIDFGYTLLENELEFYVKDSGIGIHPELHSEIFQRFRQVEQSVTRQFGGSGLGLSISKAYVEILGGHIWLISQPEKGSIFYFTLPYDKTIQKTLSNSRTSNYLKEAIESSKTILIAEDEETNYLLLEKFLSKSNFKTIWAKDGHEAYDICRTNDSIDLVLMDMKMPVMDGFEATKLIKEIRPDLPIIAQTAYSSVADRKRAILSGCADFISKPFNREQILVVIREQLAKKI